MPVARTTTVPDLPSILERVLLARSDPARALRREERRGRTVDRGGPAKNPASGGSDSSCDFGNEDRNEKSSIVHES